MTVTDPEVTRFFMTIEEAVGLVLSAAPMAEYGETFVLDMGEPIKIVDLVRRYARQLHLPDVPIRFTGLRPGEKLHEALFADGEERLPTIHPAIWATRPARLPGDFASRLARLYEAAGQGRDDQVRALLDDLLPEYQPAAASDDELALASLTHYADEF